MREPAVHLVEGDADQHRAGEPDDPGAGGPAEHAGGRLLRARRAAARAGAEQDLDGEDAHAAVDDPARERGDPVDAAVGAFRAVPDRGADEPPERVAAEADRQSVSSTLPNG